MNNPNVSQNEKNNDINKKTKTIDDMKKYIMESYPEHKDNFSELNDEMIENIYYVNIPHTEDHKRELKTNYRGIWWAELAIKEYEENKKLNFKPKFNYDYNPNS